MRPRTRLLTLITGASILGSLSPNAAAAEQRPRIDYFSAPFDIRRVLDWGDRPVWSRDGTKIAFTESDTEQSHAHELDLRTRQERCLTCQWGDKGLVERIYYLPDGSFLITAGPDQASTELYWMPQSLSRPPQPLGVQAVGEVAITRSTASPRDERRPRPASPRGDDVRHPATAPDGGFRLAAWSVRGGLWTGTIAHDGSHAAITSRREIKIPLEGLIEPYNFLRNDQALTFYHIDDIDGVLNGEMHEVNLRTGAVTNLSRDPAHNEAHSFPNERFGLEESNRISDPDGPDRGVSGHARYGDKPFDLFVVDYERSRNIRRLTYVSDIGGEANQSVPAPDGRRVAFVLDPRASGPLAGSGGLYLGEFRRP
ncbi:hypothetical protein [Actinomadura rugatobispora]|uniref:Uncharacterized protein n=1 Tax=Actinomadura rugatobispora TaxID=1994 RepID=A0ABW0ZVY5_9ACTN|nr:hypothetical protein GCM10010200_076230 [Actinomadura rugatobispora]